MIHYLLNIKACLITTVLVFLNVLSSCTHSSKKENFQISTNKNGGIEQLLITRGDYKQVYEFDSLGQCKKIDAYNKSLLDGEQLSFHNGALVQKIWYKSNIPEGYMWDFYSNTGALKAFRQIHKGLENDLGFDYYNNNVLVVKSALYFNDSGQIYFKQNFDSLSNFIGEEGKKPSFLK